MTLLTPAAIFLGFLLLLGAYGGQLVRQSAPALMRAPRTAAAALIAVLGVWMIGVAAVGPLLALALGSSAPMLPGRAGEVCQRCIDAASPLGFGPGGEAAVPSIVLLAAPVVFGLGLALYASRSHARRRSSTRELCRRLKQSGSARTVLGHQVTVIDDAQLVAFALPRSCRGTVISRATMEALTAEELEAVLAHEEAHLRQRHHVITSAVEGITRPLRWVPLVRCVADAIPHYLEVAADNAARERVSTTTLASALLKLGEKPKHPSGASRQAALLHAAGADRIRQLVAPQSSRAAAASAGAVLATGLVLMISSAAVHLPYAQAVAAGCLHL